MKENIKKGKQMVYMMIVFMMGVTVLSIISTIIQTGFKEIHVVQVLAVGGLCYGLYKGIRWTKVLLILYVLLISVFSLLGALAIFIKPLIGLLSLFFAVCYGSIGILLMFSKPVKAFLEEQKK